MSRVAERIVDAAVALLPDPQVRERYREEWHADLAGAAEVGRTPLRMSYGLALAAVRVAVAQRRQDPLPDAAGTRLAGGRRLLPLQDFVSAALGGVVTIVVSDRPWQGFSSGFAVHPLSMYVWACLALPAAWVVALVVHGAYRWRGLRRMLLGALTVVAAVSFTVMAIAPDLSRAAVVTVLFADTVIVLCGRTVRRVATPRSADSGPS